MFPGRVLYARSPFILRLPWLTLVSSFRKRRDAANHGFWCCSREVGARAQTPKGSSMAPFHKDIYRLPTSDSLYALVGTGQPSVDFNFSALIGGPSIIQAARLFNLSRTDLHPTPQLSQTDGQTMARLLIVL